ncbi:hypothetical protein MTR62_01965 [Novosphingobium sp. 1949]|uniref:Uncharacterized protein n=1 Tax=Novosphingobium organovorum TaxID=2930092 RepID=A0ABT0B971_9SPHN|nr:hypothetical protein [Novosphingobium organovorum]MCJ2181479.1 hypothetical protein [Novosphingobium organovorum]
MLLALAALLSSPVLAQDGSTASASAVSDADRAIAESMLGNDGHVTRDTSRRHCLRTIRKGEIVVCAPDEEENRVESSADLDPTGKAGTDDGRLTPPDVAGDGIFKGKATASGMCFIGPCPRAQPLLIDLGAIPEAPAGSDADKIAKGEMRVP